MTRKTHRIFGIVLALPLLIWILTGVLFNVKYRYAEAYEALNVEVPASWSAAQIAPAALFTSGKLAGGSRVALFMHPSGVPAYAGMRSGGPVAVDAVRGGDISEASEVEAARWAGAAVQRSPNAVRYGTILAYREGTRLSALTGVADPTMEFQFSGGKVVTVDRLTGEMSQTGRLNDWIDWTYRVHYLQWTPWHAVNIALVLIAAPLTIGLALSGLWLARGRG